MDKQRIEMFGVPYTTALGKDFTLMWTNRSVAKAEDLGLFSGTCGPNKSFQLLVYACLLPCHPDISPEDAADMIDIETSRGIADNLAEAVKLAREKAEGKHLPQKPEKMTTTQATPIVPAA